MDTKPRHEKECVLGMRHGRMPSFHKPVNERPGIASVHRTSADRGEVWPVRRDFEAGRGNGKPAHLAGLAEATGHDSDQKVLARAASAHWRGVSSGGNIAASPGERGTKSR